MITRSLLMLLRILHPFLLTPGFRTKNVALTDIKVLFFSITFNAARTQEKKLLNAATHSQERFNGEAGGKI